MTNREWILANTDLSPNLSNSELADAYCLSIPDSHCDRCKFITTCIPVDDEVDAFMEEEEHGE